MCSAYAGHSSDLPPSPIIDYSGQPAGNSSSSFKGSPADLTKVSLAKFTWRRSIPRSRNDADLVAHGLRNRHARLASLQ